jgi:F-type H+-transporting ATPase subunit b
MKRLAQLLGSASLMFAIAAVPVMAQEGEASPVESPTGWVFRWINFAIVLALIVYAFRKAAPSFRSRAEEISRRIAEGTRAREAAEQQRREAQAKLAGIDAEVSAMRVDAKRGAEAEAERLKDLARVEAETIQRAAEAEIAAAERAARLELKAVAARLAVERAEASLRKDLTAQNEARLFSAFVAEVGRNSN